MSGTRWNRLVALYVGDDLDRRSTERVERHLAACDACRRLEQELRSGILNLRELDTAATGDLGLGSVRGAVMARMENRRQRPVVFLRPRLQAALATAVVVIALAILIRDSRGPGVPHLAGREVPSPAPVVLAEPEPRVVSPPQPPPAIVGEDSNTAGARVARAEPPRRGPIVGTPRSAPAEAMTIKILTDDPDVVIYWIVDPKGATTHV
jgi:hypothetical protein